MESVSSGISRRRPLFETPQILASKCDHERVLKLVGCMSSALKRLARIGACLCIHLALGGRFHYLAFEVVFLRLVSVVYPLLLWLLEDRSGGNRLFRWRRLRRLLHA